MKSALTGFAATEEETSEETEETGVCEEAGTEEEGMLTAVEPVFAQEARSRAAEQRTNVIFFAINPPLKR
jgi:hypothetical protein